MSRVVPGTDHLGALWPEMWAFLEPAIRRSPDHPKVLAEIWAETAQPWAVFDENRRMVGAIVTKVQDVDGEKRCLFWLVGGRNARMWACDAVARIETWARGIGCAALWGVGRRGWVKHMATLGFERIEDFDGQAAWRRGL